MMVQSQRNTFGAILLIGLGILFLLGQIFNINFWSIAGFSWPLLVLVPGVIFLTLAFTGDRKLSGFAMPGTIITGSGAILWYQNLTNNWQSWAYMWTLYPVFVGLALMFMGLRKEKAKVYRTGRGLVNYGLIAFVLSAGFFELLIFHSNGALTSWIVPLLLIGGGGYLLVNGRGVAANKRKLGDPVFMGARNIGTSGRIAQGDDLQQRIDAAIAEDEPVDPKPRA